MAGLNESVRTDALLHRTAATLDTSVALGWLIKVLELSPTKQHLCYSVTSDFIWIIEYANQLAIVVGT